MDVASPDPEQRPSLLRRLLPWVGVAVAVAAIYDGAIFYSRWSEARDAERAQTIQEAKAAKQFLKVVGGANEIKILTFAAWPPEIRAGQKSELCFGVSGAKTVHLDPPVEEVWPALSHCIVVSPHKNTEYKLTAEDATGHSVSQTVTIQIKH